MAAADVGDDSDDAGSPTPNMLELRSTQNKGGVSDYSCPVSPYEEAKQ